MIPLGYMAKIIGKQKPDWLRAPNALDVFSVSECVNDNFIEETFRAMRNGYGLYNSPREICSVARSLPTSIQDAKLFYYEAHELDFDDGVWELIEEADPSTLSIEPPTNKTLEGFDVVTWCDGPNSHSPISCNSIAEDIQTNVHCLLNTLEEAQHHLNEGAFDEGEPGPYRIYAVYSVPWPTL